MLQSTWSEGEYHGRFRNSSTSSVSDESDQEDEEEESFEMNLEDSDDELEATEIGLKIKKFKTIRMISIAPYKQINVSHTAFKTFRALLIWLVSGKISFAALRSTSSIEETSSKVSAKSVYRLAHFLDLPELRERAFESLSQQLTRANIHLEVCIKFELNSTLSLSTFDRFSLLYRFLMK